MLYLDIISQNGGQIYLDIFSVELLTNRWATGFSIQGVLGDGYRESQLLVEYIDSEVTLLFFEEDQDAFMPGTSVCEDLPDALRLALQDELKNAGLWVDMRTDVNGVQLTCCLLATDRWHGAFPSRESYFKVPVVRETIYNEKSDETGGVERCFLTRPAVKQEQTRIRSRHAHAYSCLNKSLSTATFTTAGVALPGCSPSIQGIS
jgi:hypothetical protein